ncbi:MAG: hypothetical protein CMH53_00025 [Myxococcales bacterium]|nr:hypothetical protein [Myxococcales bacterium]
MARVMNEVQEAMAEAFVEMLEAFGVPVTVNGESHEATMSQNDVVIEDAEGGFMKSASISLKMLSSGFSTLPTFKDPVSIDGESYAVVGVNRKPNSPTLSIEVEPA